MKILVLSDSHREEAPMLAAVRQERPDALVHLGDHANDARALAEEYPLLPLVTVKGNCDFATDAPDGTVIFAVHGHRYHVKNGLLSLRYAALEQGAHIVLFGHTHCPYCEYRDGLWLLNPGACGGVRPTCGVITMENHKISCQTKEVSL